MLNDIFSRVSASPTITAAAVTSNTNGSAVDVHNFVGTLQVVLNAGNATAGTSPTLDVKLQTSDSNSTNFTDVSGATFTTVTNVANTGGVQTLNLVSDTLKQYVRAVATIGGTASPSFPASVTVLGINQIN